ncbi:hypothetical protein [Aquicoccus porphyridii]|nr:hypothetical protein [Aquicoccus porphyridii]
MIAAFDPAYRLLPGIAATLQAPMIALVIRLSRQHFGNSTAVVVPAA